MSQTVVVNPYADFEFYKTVFHGAQFDDEESFMSHAVKAADMLDVMTWKRIPGLDEADVTDDLALTILKAVCAMAEIEETSNPASLGMTVGVNSESNDGYSVSYGNVGDARMYYEDQMLKTAVRYLADTGLLYRGGGRWRE